MQTIKELNRLAKKWARIKRHADALPNDNPKKAEMLSACAKAEEELQRAKYFRDVVLAKPYKQRRAEALAQLQQEIKDKGIEQVMAEQQNKLVDGSSAQPSVIVQPRTTT